ncbi:MULTISPECIES: hypothetical protein [Elizabethkingia]|uniref:Uncharacterized protein n=1 Tax=Elizabethkingia ursingii TaxID=1756150 RepID=A0AAJ3NCK6_9FLAO|nr:MULTISPECIES: hypothetical protein [Elizabethkingia]AQW92885.1 hypothetical protein BBD30_01060 [Elizabethkingia anophelis]AQX09825.1 hypothetical protein BBD34_14810 [Elizabethkingia ursingii]OPB65700.1 hypothetical protein BAS07_15050 [Elizabethkingia anophelis]OPB75968.1 hypothetical protein BAY32_04180 [Elizabethkingia ursingii]OPB84635.1 hypothetical protein BB021_14860 [Elizabethkingia ursingii]
MDDIELTILINQKMDLELIREIIINIKVHEPVFIIEYEHFYQIKIKSESSLWELDNGILHFFQDYEFTNNLSGGGKEIRLEISRYQCPWSTDNWGRRLENPINQKIYLVKKSQNLPARFRPKVQVLFEKQEQNYFINIVSGIIPQTNEKGFLLKDSFSALTNPNDVKVFTDKLYKTAGEAFQEGLSKLSKIVEADLEKYEAEKQKAKKELEKTPRKIIRKFISACNKNDFSTILESLSGDFKFRTNIINKEGISIDGIKEFDQYLKTESQELCAKGFKIRSNWRFTDSSIEIGVKYPPLNNNREVLQNEPLIYRQMYFVIKEERITLIRLY